MGMTGLFLVLKETNVPGKETVKPSQNSIHSMVVSDK